MHGARVVEEKRRVELSRRKELGDFGTVGQEGGAGGIERRGTMFLRRFGGPLLAKVKESTGIVGLEVVPNAREVLIGLYNKTLDVVQTIPESAQYRKTVEEISRHRLKLVEESKDWEEIEAKVGSGQVEQIIEQAKDELLLIPKMAEWKPWETTENFDVQVVIEENDTPSHVPIHR